MGTDATGIVTHVQRFSVHDGPGIRTTVFLKGCPMRCPWCHNPETYRRAPEIQVFPQRCIGCQACAAACPEGAHVFGPDGHAYHRELCKACGACTATCYARALVCVGQERTADEVLDEVLADRPFYEPAGGLTLSGGEPLAQAEFCRALLELCRREGIHTAMETNLAWSWEVVAPLVELVDLFLVDVKLFDDDAHRRWTGVSNAATLANLRRLDSLGKPLLVRTPVITGVNDHTDEIARIADFLATLNHVDEYHLLPYHPLGTGKYQALGLAAPPAEFRTPTAEELAALAAAAARPNFVVRVAGAAADRQHTSTH